MSSGLRISHLATPNRRELLLGAAALSASAMLAPTALAQQFPTTKVNTTGLAVTDTEVTVGILHSVTGTMAISETGSVQAEKLAIEQINAEGGVLGRKIKFIQEDGGSDWPTFAVGNCWANAPGASIAVADTAAAPARSSRRFRVERWGMRFPDDMRRLYPA